MKKLNISKSFQKKNFKRGSMVTLFTCLFIIGLIVINLVAGKFDISKDLTKNKLFSLSDQTIKILDSTKQNITIYGFFQTGAEDPTITTILNQYKSHNNNIKIQYVDPSKNPQIAQKYSTDDTKVDVGSIVVESGSKFKAISEDSLVNYDYSDPENPQAQSIAIEQSVTSAILYVTSNKSTTIYTLQGHEESALSDQITKQLTLDNYTISPLNLMEKSGTLDKDSILLVMSPKRDLSKTEADAIKAYLANGGKAIFLMDLIKDDLPNFQSVLNYYGVAIQKAITVEGDSRYVSQNPIYLLPEQESHDILNSLNDNNLRVLIPGAQSLKLLNNPRSSLTIEPLLKTTENSWGKVNLDTDTTDKETNDITGPLNIAVAITDKSSASNIEDTRMVVVANASFTNDQISSLTADANLDFFMNSINWVQNQKDNLAIGPKDIDNYTLQISDFSRLSYTALVVVVIPAIIVIAGIVVWIIRKRK